MLNIGIVGYGFVGKAMEYTFEHNAKFSIVDPKYYTTTLEELASQSTLIFVCLPAPTLEDNTVDYSLISSTFTELSALNYTGLVVVKSTLPPAAVEDLTTYGLRYIYSPEFLREKSWREDALEPDMIVVAGDFFDCDELENIYEKHSHIKNKNRHIFTQVDYKEASLIKYSINTFLASKVVFMNQLYQLYTDIYGKEPRPDAWHYFTSVISSDRRFGKSHLAVPGPDCKFGYGGTCFPKDVKGFLGVDKYGRLSVLKEVELANTKLRLSK